MTSGKNQNANYQNNEHDQKNKVWEKSAQTLECH